MHALVCSAWTIGQEGCHSGPLVVQDEAGSAQNCTILASRQVKPCTGRQQAQAISPLRCSTAACTLQCTPAPSFLVALTLTYSQHFPRHVLGSDKARMLALLSETWHALGTCCGVTDASKHEQAVQILTWARARET